jgi:hypothetical protein
MAVPSPLRPVAGVSLDTLAQDPAKVSTLPPEVAATLAPEAAERKSRWEALAMALWVRALAGTTTPGLEGDSLISVEAAARRLAVSADWIYRRSQGDRRLPFLARVGGKLLCSSQALDRYIQQRLSR